MSSENNVEQAKSDRLLATLQRLLELSATHSTETMHQASQLLAEGMNVEKVDMFLYDPERESLTAFGVSATSLGKKVREVGLDHLSLSGGGRIVEVYRSGQPYQTGQVQHDPKELPAIKEQLGVKSEIIVPFSISAEHRGVLCASSQAPDFFTEADFHFLTTTAHWAGVVIHRAELNERYRNEATETAQRLAAEEILTVLAHDLRNYLTPLTGRLELLERRAHREKDESSERQLDALSQGMKRLQSLIANLLDAERLRQGLFSLDCQPVDLAEIIEEVVPIWSLPDHPIQVQVIDPLTVLADRDRIQQAIENLLSNAVTHAEPKTPIHVVLKEEQRKNSSWAILTVRNQGVTLSPEQFQNLFQPFVKGVRSPGLGLGLWLSRRIAQSHHGKLTARMEAENTICLTLSLPLRAQQALQNV